jgi:pilus assembly protein CpaE
MASRGLNRETALTTLLICPDKDLGTQVGKALAEPRVFELLSDLRSYPQTSTLEIRLRQIQPEVVLVDLASDLNAALEVVRIISGCQPPIQVVGVHHLNDAAILLQSLRAGACDFLSAPFASDAQREAAARIHRLRQPEGGDHQDHGKVIVFTSTKPGSGASTLATQAAFALRRATGQKILLADFDIMAGSIAFNLKLNPTYSLLDAVERSESLDPATWASLTVSANGIDVLAAPESAQSEQLETSRIHDVIECARALYDWVVVDLPTVFHPLSLFVLSEADRSFLVSTCELPSLHLGRRAVGLLSQLGFEQERCQMLVNRFGKRDNITIVDMEKIFGCPVAATFPNDYYALHKVVTRAEPLPAESELGKAISRISGMVAGLAQRDNKPAGNLLETRPALSES